LKKINEKKPLKTHKLIDNIGNKILTECPALETIFCPRKGAKRRKKKIFLEKHRNVEAAQLNFAPFRG
jgi:hypothetical protein